MLLQRRAARAAFQACGVGALAQHAGKLGQWFEGPSTKRDCRAFQRGDVQDTSQCIAAILWVQATQARYQVGKQPLQVAPSAHGLAPGQELFMRGSAFAQCMQSIPIAQGDIAGVMPGQ